MLQKLFTCESTGHSGYTFFEAMESQVSSEPVWEGIKVTETQTEASREIDSIFPDALRSRILHSVQFRTTSRMDDLGKFCAHGVLSIYLTWSF